jgi:hypothetical protein
MSQMGQSRKTPTEHLLFAVPLEADMNADVVLRPLSAITGHGPTSIGLGHVARIASATAQIPSSLNKPVWQTRHCDHGRPHGASADACSRPAIHPRDWTFSFLGPVA